MKHTMELKFPTLTMYQATAHVLDDTPTVISVGRFCIDSGFSFHWPANSENPYVETPWDRSFTLKWTTISHTFAMSRRHIDGLLKPRPRRPLKQRGSYRVSKDGTLSLIIPKTCSLPTVWVGAHRKNAYDR